MKEGAALEPNDLWIEVQVVLVVVLFFFVAFGQDVGVMTMASRPEPGMQVENEVEVLLRLTF